MLGSEEGMKEYVKSRGGEFERLRKSILDRDKAKMVKMGGKSGQVSPLGQGGRADTPIEVE